MSEGAVPKSEADAVFKVLRAQKPNKVRRFQAALVLHN